MEQNFRGTEPEKEERIDEIGFGGLKLVQRPAEFCYGVDAVLLADAASEAGDIKAAADLGTGTGVIPLILSHKTGAETIIGVEIQQNSFLSAEKSVRINGLEDRVKMILGDVSRPEELKEKVSEAAGKAVSDGGFDVVTANPPYTEGNSGLVSSAGAKMIARHEVACSLEDFFRSAAMLLKSKGHFFMIHRPARLVDIFSLGREYRLEPKMMRMIRPDAGSDPSMVLVDMVKDGGRQLDAAADLYIRERSGEYSREVMEIYERSKYQK